MSQGTDTTFGDGAEQDGVDHVDQVGHDGTADATTDSHGFSVPGTGGFPTPGTGGFPAPSPRTPTGGFRAPAPTGGFPAPRPAPPQHPWADPYRTGSWTQGQYYDQAHYADVDEAPREGNGAAVTACVFAILGLLLSLRPLVFGSNAMAADTYVALGISVLALVLGVVGARIPRRRPASVIGITLSIVALLLIAVIPTL